MEDEDYFNAIDNLVGDWQVKPKKWEEFFDAVSNNGIANFRQDILGENKSTINSLEDTIELLHNALSLERDSIKENLLPCLDGVHLNYSGNKFMVFKELKKNGKLKGYFIDSYEMGYGD